MKAFQSLRPPVIMRAKIKSNVYEKDHGLEISTISKLTFGGTLETGISAGRYNFSVTMGISYKGGCVGLRSTPVIWAKSISSNPLFSLCHQFETYQSFGMEIGCGGISFGAPVLQIPRGSLTKFNGPDASARSHIQDSLDFFAFLEIHRG